MRYNKNILGSVLIYTLFLINIAMIFALVVFNIAGVVIDNNEYQNIARKLSNNILYKGNLSVKYLYALNTNGSGYVDSLSCPTALTMSGNTLAATISTTMTIVGNSKYCLGTYNSSPVYLFHNRDYEAFTGAEYSSAQVVVDVGISTTNFPTDNTRLSFTPTGLGGIDNLDDEFNSDNYKVNSTGTTIYPNNFQDDDVLPRRTVYFYIPPDSGYTNIFFNNAETADIINDNTNNVDFLNVKIGTVTAGYVYLDVDKEFGIKIVRFSKARFDSYKELIPLELLESSEREAGIGYIQDDGTVSTGGLTTTGDEYVFDFVNNYYGIFLKNYSTGTLLFQMRSYNTTGSGVYITPIDDHDADVIRYLGNDIIIDGEGRYVYNQFELYGLKYPDGAPEGVPCVFGLGLFGYGCGF